MQSGKLDSALVEPTPQSARESSPEDGNYDPRHDPVIELLACLAAQLAGQDPDRRATIKLGGVVAFDDVVWRYPDFLARADAAYRILAADQPPA